MYGMFLEHQYDKMKNVSEKSQVLAEHQNKVAFEQEMDRVQYDAGTTYVQTNGSHQPLDIEVTSLN